MPNPIHFIESIARRQATSPAVHRDLPGRTDDAADAARAWRENLRRKIDAARETLRDEELDRAARLVRFRLRAVSETRPPSADESHRTCPTD